MIWFGRGHGVACLPSSYSVLNSFVMAFIRRCSMPVTSIAGRGDEQLVQVSGILTAIFVGRRLSRRFICGPSRTET